MTFQLLKQHLRSKRLLLKRMRLLKHQQLLQLLKKSISRTTPM
jgi:hypothetical protein